MPQTWAELTVKRLNKLVRDEDYNKDKSVPRAVGLSVIADELKTGSLENIAELVFLLHRDAMQARETEKFYKHAMKELGNALERGREWIDNHNLDLPEDG